MGLIGRKAFALVAGLGLAASIGFAAILQFGPLNASLTTAIDDIGEGLAAFVAAACCVLAYRRATGRTRLAWALMGASASAWAAGETVWSIYEVGLAIDVPYPSLADAGFVAAIPLAVAAIVAFWQPGRGLLSSWRIALDGVIIALALTFVAWALGLKAVWADATQGDPLVETILDAAYPLGDILTGTVLILAIRRATHQQQARMVLLLGGIAAYSLADSAFSYLSANGLYTVHGSVLDTGWFAGYLMIALAALWPGAEARRVQRPAYDFWQLVLPWFAVMGAAGTCLALVLTGRTLDTFLIFLAAAGASLLAVSMALAQRDSVTALRASQRSEATLAEVIARAPAGVVRVSADLRIIDANPRFLSLLQTTASDARGALITHFFTGGEAVKFAEQMETLRADSQTIQSDAEALRADGTKVWVHWSATAVAGAEGAVDYFIAMFEDTTARHEAEAAAAASVELMHRLNTLKTEFLQSVSHEFKTALIGIQGFSEFMRDADQLDLSDARAFAADIYRDAERLDRMVTEMIALDNAESDRINVRLAPVDINAVILREVAAAEKGSGGNPISTALAPDLPLVSGDSHRLGEIVRTLLENALKYSPDGGRVTVTSEAARDQVCVSVADEGTGSRGDFDNGLFNPQDLYADNPIRKVVGTGLGLGMSRQLVQLHGGRLWVDRVPGKGSVFHFTLHPAASAGMVA